MGAQAWANLHAQAWANLHELCQPITGLEMCDRSLTHRPIVEVPHPFGLWDLKLSGNVEVCQLIFLYCPTKFLHLAAAFPAFILTQRAL